MTPMGTKIHQKSIKIKAWTSKCCFVVCYAPQCPKIGPGFPSTTKKKQPIMPNDRFAYQRCQDALATMPRICNPEAMGNDRGPAAEGVAHKIRRTPAGGAGREWTSSPCSAESEDSGRPPHCRRPLQIRAKNASFSCLNFSTLFFMLNLQNL